jgi:hypothetical protein
MNSNKTLKIKDDLHEKIKKFCNFNNIKMNKWCEMILYEGLLYSIERANRRNNSIYPTSKNENQ